MGTSLEQASKKKLKNEKVKPFFVETPVINKAFLSGVKEIEPTYIKGYKCPF
jgi:hypothetical protein